MLSIRRLENDRERNALEVSVSDTLPLSEKRVLLVEDNAINQQVAHDILTRMGASVDVANDGLEALNWFGDHGIEFDAILMDIQMPGIDGYEATRRIRLSPRGRTVPIIAITANAMPADRQKCMDAGMSDYLSKPFDIRQVAKVVAKWVGRSPAVQASPEGQHPAPIHQALPSGIDVDYALGRVDNDRPLLAGLLRIFIEHFTSLPDEIAAAVKSGDIARLLGVAHSLKGSALQIGARNLHEAVKEFERNASSTAIAPGQEIANIGIEQLIATLTEALASAGPTLERLMLPDRSHHLDEGPAK